MRHFSPPTVDFSLTGRIAGRAYIDSWKVKYNVELFEHNRTDFLDRTVPHELAHLVARTLYPFCTSHGQHWRTVMERLGVKDITRLS